MEGKIMPREVHKCELEDVEITEEYYLDLQAFLRDLGLSCLEAQIILEVHKYPEHYIDSRTLKKKIPSELLRESSLKSTLKNLVESGFLKYYESKKPEICVLCDEMGHIVAEEIQKRCYSEALKYYPSMREHFEHLKKQRCFDPENFREGERRTIHLGNFKLDIKIEKILTSDIIVDYSIEGTPIYGRRLIGYISKCPKCGRKIPIDYSYDNKNIYTESLKVKCPSCGLEFFLAYCLKWAYT